MVRLISGEFLTFPSNLNTPSEWIEGEHKALILRAHVNLAINEISNMLMGIYTWERMDLNFSKEIA